MKKFIALFITVVMLIGIISLPVSAATTVYAVLIGDITEPVAGQTPDYVATYGTGYNFTTDIDSSNSQYGICWIDTTNGERVIAPDEVFAAGHTYRVAVIVKAQSGYVFSKKDNYSTDVTGKINDKQGKAYAISGYNAGEYVGITYNFGECDYARISSVGVKAFNLPAAGEALAFSALSVDDAYYINSISWKDLTTSQNMPEGASAVAGHKYEVEIWIRVNDGYRLKVDSDGCPDVTAKIGTYNATVITSFSDVVVGITDTYIVPDDITTVSVAGIDAPVTGESVDKTAECGECYEITEIIWVDTTGEYADYIYDIETFDHGREYTVQITLKAKDGYEFNVVDGYTEVTGTLNGKNATVYGSHSETEISIGYEFPATAVSEHTHDYKKIVTAPTCTENGYTTYTCECGDSYKSDEVPATDHNYGEWEVIKNAEVGVEGKEQRKCAYCDATEERAIPSLTNPEADILIGDVNKDGKINAIDARAALRIGAQLDVPTEYQKIAADYDKNGKVNAIDARAILRKGAQLDP